MNPDTTLHEIVTPSVPLYFQASEVAKIMGCESGWVARLGQIIAPEIAANGKGYRAAYSFRNLVEMRIVEEMIKFGVPRKRIASYLITLRASTINVFSDTQEEAWIVIDGEWRWQIANTFTAIRLGWQNHIPDSLLAISIGKIKKELKNQL